MDIFGQCAGLPVVLFARPVELGFSERAANASKMLEADWIGDLVQKTEAELLRLPNTGRKTVGEIKHSLANYGLRLGMHLPEWERIDPEAERKSIPGGIRYALSKLDGTADPERASNLQDEMLRTLATVVDGRNLELVLSLWGFDGTARKTLEEVGGAYGMTRERVRQIEAKTIKKLGSRWYQLPLLDSALATVEKHAPVRADDVSSLLCANGIESLQISASSLLRAAEVFERDTELTISSVTAPPLVGPYTMWKTVRAARKELRRATQSFGCTSLSRIQFRLAGTIEGTDQLRRAFELMNEVVWLDVGRNWLYSAVPSRNRLYNLLEKIFSVTKKVHVAELRQAVSRPHRMKYVPPAEVLAAFCERFGFTRSPDNQISSIAHRDADLGELDGAFVRGFRQLGSPLTREELEDYCVEEEGMKVSSFYQRLTYCPLFLRLGPGVYGLVGSRVAPGSVESAKERIQEERIAPQYGWSSDGRLWLVFRLSRASVNSGTCFVPSFVNEHAEGCWALALADGALVGKLEIKKGIAAGLREAFQLVGVDPGDFCLLQFDLKRKTAMVRVGGSDLQDIGSGGDEEDDESDEFDEFEDDREPDDEGP